MLSTLLKNLREFSGRSDKSSFFDKKWSSATGFQKNVERKSFEFEEANAPERELSDQIITKYQQQPKIERREFIDKVTEDTLTFLAQRRSLRYLQMQKIAACHESMMILVRRIFDTLELYSIELNSRVGFSELQTAVTRPSLVREVVRYSKMRQPLETVTHFRARMTTSFWSLVIRGSQDSIDVFLIPVNRAIGLSRSESSFEPICQITSTLLESGVVWHLEDKPLNALLEENLCMELFLTLINHTKAQLHERDEWDAFGGYRN